VLRTGYRWMSAESFAMRSPLAVFPDALALACAAADRFIALVCKAIAARGVAHVVLAGGSTPRAMNQLLASESRRDALDWSRVRIYFGDERNVGPNDPESNYGMTRETLLAPLAIAPEHVFRIPGELEAHAAAIAYTDVLNATVGEQPTFDVVFLGMGPDGHTASIFPGTLAQLDSTTLVAPVWVEKFATWRITLTPRVLNAARAVVITCGGEEKSAALHAVLEGPHVPDTYPIQLIRPTDGSLEWLIDAPAAQAIRSS
jgi:6-phosphogluconolactonase